MKKIAILGSTGSIGTQTLEVVRENGDIEVLGLAAVTVILQPEVILRCWKNRSVNSIRRLWLYGQKKKQRNYV